MNLWQSIQGDAAIRLEDDPRGTADGKVLASRPKFTQEAVWVVAARNGDRAAFGWLYERYFRMVHGILLARVPRTDVRDLVQDVFLSALRRLSTLREPSAFGGWLAQIARNRATDYYRRGHNSPQEELTEGASDERPSALHETTEAFAALRAIRELPDTYRETLILRFVEGMTGPEIAARTGLTHGSVRVNLHRGMKLLREMLARGARP